MGGVHSTARRAGGLSAAAATLRARARDDPHAAAREGVFRGLAWAPSAFVDDDERGDAERSLGRRRRGGLRGLGPQSLGGGGRRGEVRGLEPLSRFFLDADASFPGATQAFARRRDEAAAPPRARDATPAREAAAGPPQARDVEQTQCLSQGFRGDDARATKGGADAEQEEHAGRIRRARRGGRKPDAVAPRRAELRLLLGTEQAEEHARGLSRDRPARRKHPQLVAAPLPPNRGPRAARGAKNRKTRRLTGRRARGRGIDYRAGRVARKAEPNPRVAVLAMAVDDRAEARQEAEQRRDRRGIVVVVERRRTPGTGPVGRRGRALREVRSLLRVAGLLEARSARRASRSLDPVAEPRARPVVRRGRAPRAPGPLPGSRASRTPAPLEDDRHDANPRLPLGSPPLRLDPPRGPRQSPSDGRATSEVLDPYPESLRADPPPTRGGGRRRYLLAPLGVSVPSGRSSHRARARLRPRRENNVALRAPHLSSAVRAPRPRPRAPRQGRRPRPGRSQRFSDGRTPRIARDCQGRTFRLPPPRLPGGRRRLAPGCRLRLWPRRDDRRLRRPPYPTRAPPPRPRPRLQACRRRATRLLEPRHPSLETRSRTRGPRKTIRGRLQQRVRARGHAHRGKTRDRPAQSLHVTSNNNSLVVVVVVLWLWGSIDLSPTLLGPLLLMIESNRIESNRGTPGMRNTPFVYSLCPFLGTWATRREAGLRACLGV